MVHGADVFMEDTASQDRAEAVITLKDGTNRLLGYTSSPGGSKGTHVVVFQDITELVEKTKRSRRAKELALVGEMISRLSHEIKNPLASILVGLKTLHRGTSQSSQHGYIVQLISEEVDSLTRTVNQLLDAARPSPCRSQTDSHRATAGTMHRCKWSSCHQARHQTGNGSEFCTVPSHRG